MLQQQSRLRDAVPAHYQPRPARAHDGYSPWSNSTTCFEAAVIWSVCVQPWGDPPSCLAQNWGDFPEVELQRDDLGQRAQARPLYPDIRLSISSRSQRELYYVPALPSRLYEHDLTVHGDSTPRKRVVPISGKEKTTEEDLSKMEHLVCCRGSHPQPCNPPLPHHVKKKIKLKTKHVVTVGKLGGDCFIAREQPRLTHLVSRAGNTLCSEVNEDCLLATKLLKGRSPLKSHCEMGTPWLRTGGWQSRPLSHMNGF